MYRRRRAVALVVVLAAVSLVVFCVYSLGRGVADGVSLLRPTPIARESVPAPKKTSGVNDCGASDVKLSLTAASQGVPVGGSLDFTASISYEGTSSCLLDLSDVVLTVSSGAASYPLEGWSAYCASKAGAAMLLRCLDLESRQDGIRAIGLSPGTVATDMQQVIRASGVNPVSQLDWSAHIPADWPARALVWLATPAADDLVGTEVSLRDEAIRRRIGLVA